MIFSAQSVSLHAISDALKRIERLWNQFRILIPITLDKIQISDG